MTLLTPILSMNSTFLLLFTSIYSQEWQEKSSLHRQDWDCEVEGKSVNSVGRARRFAVEKARWKMLAGLPCSERGFALLGMHAFIFPIFSSQSILAQGCNAVWGTCLFQKALVQESLRCLFLPCPVIARYHPIITCCMHTPIKKDFYSFSALLTSC